MGRLPSEVQILTQPIQYPGLQCWAIVVLAWHAPHPADGFAVILSDIMRPPDQEDVDSPDRISP